MLLLALPAEAAEVRLEHAWYRVELIVFDRPTDPPLAVDDASAMAADPPFGPSGEVLLRSEPRRFPSHVLAFDDGEERAAYYPLDAETLAAPAVPIVDSAYLASMGVESRPAAAEPEPMEGLDTGEPATAAAGPAVPAPIPGPAEQLAEATARFEQTLLATSYRWLDPRELALGTEARRLARADGYRVLHHGAWVLPVPPRESPEPMLLQVGERQGDVWTVEGTLAITLARYLHVQARLWHTGSTDDRLRSVDALGVMSAEPDRYFELDEQRRLRTGELHYLDHPRFGVLIRIDPIRLPDDLSALAATVP